MAHLRIMVFPLKVMSCKGFEPREEQRKWVATPRWEGGPLEKLSCVGLQAVFQVEPQVANWVGIQLWKILYTVFKAFVGDSGDSGSQGESSVRKQQEQIQIWRSVFCPACVGIGVLEEEMEFQWVLACQKPL